MTIPFANIPANIRVPLFYAEVDPSRANTASQVQRALLIGQVTSGTTLTANVPVIVGSADASRLAAGLGSVLAGMIEAWRANDPFGELWILPLADDGSAVAATGNIVFTGPTTAAGTLNLYVAGTLVAVPLASGRTAAQVATAVTAAINAVTSLPVTAAVDGSNTAKVNLTARNAGPLGNDIDVRLNYRGVAAGEATPAGLSAAITAMANGATAPSLSTGLANLQDLPFDFIVNPYTDATSLAAVAALLSDTAGRWSYTVQVYGHAFTAYRGTYGTLSSWGDALNDQHLSAIGIHDSPTPVWRWAAAYAATAAVSLRIDPGRPLQTLPVAGVLAPPVASRFSLSQRNTLLFDGISTYRVDPSGAVTIENVITTYQRNGLGQADDSYLQVETMFLLMLVLRRLSAVISTKYARVKLASNGTRPAAGSAIVTPAMIRADLIAQYRQLEAEGYVQNADAFAANLVVEKDTGNPNRVNVLWPGTLINQLRIFALLAQFRLS